MIKQELLDYLSKRIISQKWNNPLVVWINGVDGSGKSHLSKELYHFMKQLGYDMEVIGVDDFLNNRKIRYTKWIESPEWFYYDTYNHEDFLKYVLIPFQKWEWKYCKKIFDIDTNREVKKEMKVIKKSQIVLIEGIFLFRPELNSFFDYKIFLNVSFDTTLERMLKRDTDLGRLWGKKEVIERFNIRYMPWQKLYFSDAKPQEKSDILIDNTDYNNPIII